MSAVVMRLPDLLLYEAAMRLAIAEARQARAEGDLPYGAVVVTGRGELVAACHDKVARSGDPTRHGEIDAVRLAIAQRGSNLSDCLLVSTIEPCSMCSGAAWYAGISTVVYGIGMAELKALRSDSLEEPLGPTDRLFRGMKRRIRIVPNVLHEECVALWVPRGNSG